jgi:DNA-damage-inducible protein J
MCLLKKEEDMTATKSRTNVYLDLNMKTKAKEIFKQYGISLSDAFNMFLTQSVLEKGFPFQIKIPNSETIKAMEEVENGETQTVSFEDHMEEMKQCITD